MPWQTNPMFPFTAPNIADLSVQNISLAEIASIGSPTWVPSFWLYFQNMQESNEFRPVACSST